MVSALMATQVTSQSQAKVLDETVKTKKKSTSTVRTYGTPETNKAYAKDYMLSSYGWGEDQFSCLDQLWQRESGWKTGAKNNYSGAYGIPQALPGRKMSSAGKDWRVNPETQIKWGLTYINGRYETPCGAWSHFTKRKWY